jgi:miniconductance mechanosensitive channel
MISAETLVSIGTWGGILLTACLAYLVARFVIVKTVHRLAERTRATWDNVLVKNKVFSALSQIAPALIINYGYQLSPVFPKIYLLKGMTIYVGAIVLILFGRLLDAALEIYNQHPMASRRPIKGYIQLVKIFIFIVGIVLVIAVLLGISPWKLVSGIGALTAVIMLIFKDTILSLVASVQLASNDLLRIGDWIEMPQFNADGDIIDIALHAVQVQNWDRTIVSIPTAKFLDNSFKNWRGMQETRGRRIKRALLIDQSSIGFLNADQLAFAGNITILQRYMSEKEQEIERHNQAVKDASSSPVNLRQLTNIGTFRAYANAYLKAHPHIRQDLTLMVRHLQPEADSGLPVEIYAFTNTTVWTEYESIQADIFDHFLAILPAFGLRTYQRNALIDNR